jgi:hypothetical protein
MMANESTEPFLKSLNRQLNQKESYDDIGVFKSRFYGLFPLLFLEGKYYRGE